MSQRHKHADIIHAWAEGAEIQLRKNFGDWIDLHNNVPSWNSDYEYRIKPKEPAWWENIPEHGILIKIIDDDKEVSLCFERELDSFDFTKWEPLTNEEIERFKR